MVQSSFHLSAAACLALAVSAAPAPAQTAGGAANLSGGKVKIGVLTDIAGPTAMANGRGSVIAAEMAAEDFAAGLNVEVISADHQGKPDVGSQIAAAGSTWKASTRSPTCRVRRSVSLCRIWPRRRARSCCCPDRPRRTSTARPARL